MSELRICVFGTYEPDYARNQYLLEGLRLNDVEVIQCRRTLWHGTPDKVAKAAGGWKRPGFWAKLARAYLGLARDYTRAGPHDVVFVAYAGQIDVYLAWLLTRFSRRPLVLDALLSIYNSIVNERKVASPNSLDARLVYALEQNACRLADRVLLDTQAHIRYFSKLYRLSEERFSRIPISADDRFFQPATERAQPAPEKGAFEVIYHGKYIPNAGVEYILEAAALIADDAEVHFSFIGEGEGKADAQELAANLALKNVTFFGWMEKPELVRRLQAADVCLGVFGDTPQARQAMSNKVLEALAVGVPVLTGDTASNREVVRHGETAYLVPVADSQAIADGLRAMKADPSLRARLSAAGIRLFQEQYTPAAVGRQLKELLEQLVQR